MRISDWSSDVCSSDLADAAAAAAGQRRREADVRHAQRFHQAGGVELVEIAGPGGRIIGKAVDLLMADPGIGTGVHDRLCRSEEHTSELQSLMRISYAVFCLKKKKQNSAQTILQTP